VDTIAKGMSTVHVRQSLRRRRSGSRAVSGPPGFLLYRYGGSCQGGGDVALDGHCDKSLPDHGSPPQSGGDHSEGPLHTRSTAPFSSNVVELLRT
jgi:hypothetical protein